MLDITLPAKILFHIGPVPITNAVLATYAVTAVVIVFALWFSRSIRVVPGRLQVGLEAMQEFWIKQTETAFGDTRLAQRLFPMFLTLFFIILIANQFSVFPLINSLMFGDTPLFRTPTSDLSHTIALALLMIGFSHAVAFTTHPLKHIGNFIKIKPFFQVRSLADFGNALLGFFLGLLDIVGEFAKVMSLSGRLFGNIFAGDVMVAVIISLASFTQFIVPLPFIFLSMFSGVVQAAVFTMISILFIAGTAGGHLQERQNKNA